MAFLTRHTLLLTGIFSVLIFLSATTAQATDLRAHTIDISRQGDMGMSCQALSKEVSSMEDLIFQAQKAKKESKIASRSVGVVETVGSYFIGSFGGVIGIFAAGHFLNNATDTKTEEASNLQNNASQRRTLMAGLFIAKDCEGPLQNGLQMAAIEPAAGPQDLRPRKPRYND